MAKESSHGALLPQVQCPLIHQNILGQERLSKICRMKIHVKKKKKTFNGSQKGFSRTPLFRSPKGNEKMFEIAGLRNNRGSVKGKGKSEGMRSSFEVAGTSN